MDAQHLSNVALAKFLGQDPPRTGKKIALRARTRSLNTVICGVNLAWEDGVPIEGAESPENERSGVRDIVVEIFEEDLPKFRAAVEDFRDAKGRLYEPKLIDERLEQEVDAWTSGENGESAKPLETFPGSWERSFRELLRRDPRPLIAIEVVKKGAGEAQKAA